jgi:hypothetical protein
MRAILLAAAVAVLTICSAGTANAHYFMDHREAEHYARDWAHYKLDYAHTEAACRPQWNVTETPGYVYHSWLCAWRGMDADYTGLCRGLVIIEGSSDQGSYYHRRMYSRGPCPA